MCSTWPNWGSTHVWHLDLATCKRSASSSLDGRCSVEVAANASARCSTAIVHTSHLQELCVHMWQRQI